jgi:hypothetical protein
MTIENHKLIINAKNYFLVYQNCPIELEIIVDHLKNLQTSTTIKFVKVHRDGEHVIGLVQFETQYKCQNPRFFDIDSKSGIPQLNPIISSCRSSIIIQGFIHREGDVCQWGEPQIDKRLSNSHITNRESYKKALAAEDKKTALQILHDEQPRDFVLFYFKIKKNLDNIHISPRQTFKPMYNLSMFSNVPEEMQKWAESIMQEDSKHKPYRPKSIIIEGESRTGKTCWARAIGRHNYVMGHFDLNPRKYSNQAEYNVIDDVPPNKLKHWKELIGAQRDWQSNCKYRKPAIIQGGIPAIILCNKGEGSSYEDFLKKSGNSELKEWTEANATFIRLEEPLWKRSN